jgi:hypothetical protein
MEMTMRRSLLALWLLLAACAPSARVASLESCDPSDAGEIADAGEAEDAAPAPLRILRLGIGQSNQLGYGNSGFAELPHPSRSDIPTSRIVYIGGTERTSFWEPLADIGHDYPPTAPVHWHNAELSATTRLRDEYGYDVIATVVARGGTGFNFWRGCETCVAGNLYQKTRDFVYRLYNEHAEEMEGRTILLNINLGEQSAKYDEESQLYGQYMIELVAALRAHFPAIAHVMLVRLHDQALLHSNLYTQRIIDHQEALAVSEGWLLQDPTPIGPLKGDNAHYTAETGYALGIDEADAWHAVLEAP